MKKMLPYLFLFPCLLFGQSIFLSEAIPVSPEGTGSRAPRLALLDGNRPVVYWGKTGANAILNIAVWENGSFGAPVAINTNGIEPDLWNGGLGPHIAAKGNTIYLVFESYGEGIYCVKSSDDGQSFDAPVSVYDAPPGRVATLPTIAIDPALNPIISFVTTDFNEQNAQYEITRSIDGGLTFPPTSVANVAATGAEVCECCPASIGVFSEEEFYLGFRNNDANLRDIWVAQSIDGGANFDTATDIDDTDWVIQSCPQSGPDMMVDGDSVFTVFYSGATGTNIYFSSLSRSSMEKGYQFQFPTATGQDLSQNYPSIAGSGDTIGVVWQEVGDNSWDIQMAWSVNGSGDLLNNYLTVDDKAVSQKQPDIAFQDGRFHIIYEDQATGRVIYRFTSSEQIIAASDIKPSDFLVNISPNPFSGTTILTIENYRQELITASLLNSQGQNIRIYETTGNVIEINMLDLGKGFYFLKINRGQEIEVKPLVKY